MTLPDDHIPAESYASVHGELRSLARVWVRALGVVIAYWTANGQPPEHPYRQAALMVVRYLQRRYHV